MIGSQVLELLLDRGAGRHLDGLPLDLPRQFLEEVVGRRGTVEAVEAVGLGWSPVMPPEDWMGDRTGVCSDIDIRP